MKKIERLQQLLTEVLADKISSLSLAHGELTLVVASCDLLAVMQELRDNAQLNFSQCQDVCGVDYLSYGEVEEFSGLRFATVYHLLSVAHNWRLRVKTWAIDNALPMIPSLRDLWSSVDWFEREAFDLFGIIFEGHPDLRRILTDYGFIGHPFRKDFPLSGYMEMRYDEEQQRVIYQPVTIEPREVTPRIIREEHYGGRN